MEKKRLLLIQYRAREVTSGLLSMGFADERSLTSASLFAHYVNTRLQKQGVDLSCTVCQTDNGAEYVGRWNKKGVRTYRATVESIE